MTIKSIAYFSFLYSGFSVVVKLLGFFLFLWIAKEVSFDDYGTFGLLYAIQIGISTFAIAGINEIIIGRLKKHKSFNKKRLLFAKSLVLFLIVSFITICILFIYLFITKIFIDYIILSIVILTAILMAFSNLQSQMYRLQESHKSALEFHALGPLLVFIFAIVCFYFYKNIESYFFGQLIGIFIFYVIMIFKKSIILKIYMNNNIKFDLISLFPFVVIAFFGWLSGYGNSLIINELFSVEDVAIFTFLITFASILQLVASSMNMVWSPRFYSIVHILKIEDVEKQNRLFYGIQSVILGIIGAFILVILPIFFSYMDGFAKYSNYYFELMFLFLGYILLPIWWHCSNYYLVFERGKDLRNIVIVTSIIGIAIWLILMLFFGKIGIYVGFFVQMLLRSVWIYIESRKHWNLKISYEGVIIGILITYFGYLSLG
ncbi:lipopolysaccharide biosynthesis protein [Arcobacter cryaerophilus gv. pseudocryaerophilus]|uniref:Lipopolysaccharide biosynthesis protein n=2 Tax=Arcobacteraceae TaxID=2808963 RepID=A0AAU0P2Y6_9BACT|nr:lipopolysaccharide biosynthesis protein [Arcobacter sp. AZ-2023]WPD03060.1 lipopolysaccharide biosynthesis protein [Arcobacter sp. DSM 115972]